MGVDAEALAIELAACRATCEELAQRLAEWRELGRRLVEVDYLAGSVGEGMTMFVELADRAGVLLGG